jgi:spermidine/putrescine transport system permease protein
MVDLLKWHGFLNKGLLSLHIINHPLSLLYTNTAVFFGLVYNLLPFMILPILNTMETIDNKCFEAARDLGASRWQIFSKIFWPQTQAGVMNGVIMVFLPAMTLFYIPNILGGAKSILIGNLIQNQFLFLNNWPQGGATSSILTLLLLIVFWFTQSKEANKK